MKLTRRGFWGTLAAGLATVGMKSGCECREDWLEAAYDHLWIHRCTRCGREWPRREYIWWRNKPQQSREVTLEDMRGIWKGAEQK